MTQPVNDYNTYLNDKNLVSVIIPVYNVARYLPNCLESISFQTHKNLQIIVVDDGSTDSSKDICDTYAKSEDRSIIIHQTNQGLWAARNAGRKVAVGDYIMYVDGDDYLHVDTISQLYSAINKDGGYNMAMADYLKTYSTNEQIMGNVLGNDLTIGAQELVRFLFQSHDVTLVGAQWGILFRTDFIKSILNREYPRACDFDFMFRVCLKLDKAILRQCKLYYYVQRPDSLIHHPYTSALIYSSLTKILYDNYTELLISHKKWEHYLLRKLYRQMVLFKGKKHKTAEQKETFQTCDMYEKATHKAYWLNWRINPFEKIGVTILLHNPRLTRWLMRVTKNY